MKKILPVLFGIALVVFLFSCSEKIRELAGRIQAQESGGDEVNDVESNAVKTDRDITYVNGYLGVSFTVPKGWWLYDVNSDNFSEDEGDTGDPAALDIYFDGGQSYISLISFANLQYSGKDNHLGFDINAESLEEISSLAEYMEYYEAFMLEPENGTEYSMLDSGRIDINGSDYEKRVFLVSPPSEGREYELMTLTRPAGENFYLTIVASYWPENRNAQASIISAVGKGSR
jgi:hypothetical protein